jgi:hypothetical protein
VILDLRAHITLQTIASISIASYFRENCSPIDRPLCCQSAAGLVLGSNEKRAA